MRTRTLVCCLAALVFLLSASAARAQVGVNFANSGTGWAEPWYGAGFLSNSFRLFLFPDLCDGVGEIPVGVERLAGTGFTAELWAGPEGSSEFGLQFLARTTFRTGAAAGLVAPQSFVAVPFAQPGQRVAMQLRVYFNVSGSVTSWEQAQFSTITGTSKLFTSAPLGATPVTLQGMGSFCLTTDGIRLAVPLLTLTTGGIMQLWGAPTPVKFPESSWLHRSLVAGDTATLKLEVPNPATSIAWSRHGIDLPGQTSQSLVLSNIQPDQSGEYSVRVTVNIGSSVFTRTNSVWLNISLRPFLEDATRDITGTFTARLRGVTNRIAAIESSTDLRNWQRGPSNWIGGNRVCTGNTVTNPPLFGPQLFYRAVILP